MKEKKTINLCVTIDKDINRKLNQYVIDNSTPTTRAIKSNIVAVALYEYLNKKVK